LGAGHSHGTARSPRGIFKLKIALGLTFLYMLAEAVGGWFSNSLALIADAGHMLTDVAALSLTLLAFRFASRPATSKKTYGYYRLEILAAFVNGVALVVLSLWIIYEAYERWTSAPEIKGAEMLAVAIGGLIVNFIALMLLHADSSENLNMRGAWLHIVGDLLGSVAAIVAGLAIIFFGYVWADAVTSVVISVIIIASSWRLILNSVNVLLEGTPSHIDMASLQGSILRTPGVTGVHDLHVWTISSGIDALSAHISHDRSQGHSELLAVIRDKLHDEFGIDHLTIQMETAELEAEAVYVCETGTRCFIPSNEHSSKHD
jgi:cobalt-zinc-cadmium efflux system protein